MLGKRKVHIRTDLSISKENNLPENEDRSTLEPQKPFTTLINFGFNADASRTYDFKKHYGAGIDSITSICQRQIERFLAKQDSELATSTIATITRSGLDTFLSYLGFRAKTLQRTLVPSDINRNVITDFLRHLACSNFARSVQKLRYDQTRVVFQALARRGLIQISIVGRERTFPLNPFPNSARQVKGEKPLSRVERQSFAAAVKTAVMPLFQDDQDVTPELLTYALLIIALHTGRNTTPLLEMTSDCLRPHPKENTLFLVLWKRRSHSTNKVVLRNDCPGPETNESLRAVNVPVIRLIRRVISLAEPLQVSAPPHLASRIWLYRSRSKKKLGQVTALSESTIASVIKKLVSDAALVDAGNKPLRLNIGRLRKTFANRMFELLEGDLATTAVALGNSPSVAGRHYMAPGEDAARNWRFLGEALTNELLQSRLGATERTPVGRCKEPLAAHHSSPKLGEHACMDFLNCLRCRNYVVTGDDLHRLFSFYWRVLREKQNMRPDEWHKHYAHIPRLIERDVIEIGVRNKIFKLADVNDARERARLAPHPFWRFESIASLGEFLAPPEDSE